MANAAAADDSGEMGSFGGEFLAGTGGFSVGSAAGTEGREVSILSVLAIWPDNLRLLTDSSSFASALDCDVSSAASFSLPLLLPSLPLPACGGWDSGTGGKAGKVPEGADIAGGECEACCVL